MATVVSASVLLIVVALAAATSRRVDLAGRAGRKADDGV